MADQDIPPFGNVAASVVRLVGTLLLCGCLTKLYHLHTTPIPTPGHKLISLPEFHEKSNIQSFLSRNRLLTGLLVGQITSIIISLTLSQLATESSRISLTGCMAFAYVSEILGIALPSAILVFESTFVWLARKEQPCVTKEILPVHEGSVKTLEDAQNTSGSSSAARTSTTTTPTSAVNLTKRFSIEAGKLTISHFPTVEPRRLKPKILTSSVGSFLILLLSAYWVAILDARIDGPGDIKTCMWLSPHWAFFYILFEMMIPVALAISSLSSGRSADKAARDSSLQRSNDDDSDRIFPWKYWEWGQYLWSKETTIMLGFLVSIVLAAMQLFGRELDAEEQKGKWMWLVDVASILLGIESFVVLLLAAAGERAFRASLKDEKALVKGRLSIQ